MAQALRQTLSKHANIDEALCKHCRGIAQTLSKHRKEALRKHCAKALCKHCRYNYIQHTQLPNKTCKAFTAHVTANMVTYRTKTHKRHKTFETLNNAKESAGPLQNLANQLKTPRANTPFH